jgi:uncharacterized protein YjbI with pentapeptide repeats
MLQGAIVQNEQNEYVAPSSREELVARYNQGERNFPGIDLSDADLSRVVLDGANFEVHSWFCDANFEGASLRGVIFRECNVKCASFKNADLTGASFEGAAIESVDMSGSVLEGVKFAGATFYGVTLEEGDEFPP